MKKITSFIILALLICSLSFSQQSAAKNVKWYSLKEALELNKTKPKKILIDIYTDWCGWCKKMDAETFEHPIISAYLNSNFYPVKFNAEGRDSVEFAGYKFGNPGQGSRSTHQFAVALFQSQKLDPGYPSIAYLTENLQLVGVMPGFLNPLQMEPILNFIVEDKFKTTSLDEYQKTFVSKIK
jgi:thioredoxin-related protein